MSMPRAVRLLAVIAAFALLAAACSGDTTTSEPAAPTGPTGSTGGATGGGAGLTIEAQDFQFSPSSLSGGAGETLTVTVTNTGGAGHTFTIDDAGIDEELSAGDSVDVEVTLPDSGSLRFYCRFHEGSGMEGELTVA